jgi:hypothetical protein
VNGPPARAGSGTAGAGGYSGGTYDQLNRDSQYRREGTQRTNDYGSYQRSGSSSASSYRSSGRSSYSGGGRARGGGGGRRR